MAKGMRGCCFFAAAIAALRWNTLASKSAGSVAATMVGSTTSKAIFSRCPLEPTDNPFLKHIQHPCYPVREFGGLLFAYMGPLDKIPEFPLYDIWQKPGGTLKARMGPRVGGPVNCNWLQAEENLMDALHTFWL